MNEIKRFSGYLVAKPNGDDPLGLDDMPLMIDYIKAERGLIHYLQTNEIGDEERTVSDSDYEFIKIPGDMEP
jgi:hypothetical protein